ncbi:MAG: wbmP [Nitrospirae bacterium]|nr:MAG: wbmP [Nitrospirota bacterium]
MAHASCLASTPPKDDCLVAIHQPNFFPWLGYFNKIARSDVFIMLENVQFPKTGGTWMNRVRIMDNGRPAWLTMPIVRSYHGVRSVRDMHINNGLPWRPRVLNAIQGAYGRAPHFKAVFEFLSDALANPTDNLAEFNLTVIRTLVEALGLSSAKLVSGSSLNVEGNSTDLLVAMVKAVGGTAYLCGGGAGGYQQDDKFTAADVRLRYQDFRHPVYQQINSGPFLPGLSIIDVLMNCGFEQARALVGASVLTTGARG